MSKGFNSSKTYHAGEFCCKSCNHKTIIFIDTSYTLFDIYFEDRFCNSCAQEKEYVCDGTLILRYDWPDADDNPWQIQGAYVPEELKYCTDCRDEVPIPEDWKKLIVGCSQCDGDMIFNE